MGVKSLWNILECTGETVDLNQIRGQILAIDLAGWVVSSAQCRSLGGRVAKPHLRNVFFRTTALLALGVKPVFVLDGAAPELKRDVMEKRKAASQASQASQSEVKSLSRTRLKALMNEAKFMLAAMGLKCIQSKGEGESLCAQLNRDGKVHAIISDDSDVFCFGGETVLRNFSISPKAFSAERFTRSRLQEKLGLSRDRFLLLSLLLGCDFFPGVNGVGKESVMQLLGAWPGEWNAIEVLDFWVETKFEPWTACFDCGGDQHCSLCKKWKNGVVGSKCLCSFMETKKDLVKIENGIKRKCKMVEASFWKEEYPKILQEFHATEEYPDMKPIFEHTSPNASQCLSILTKKLLWEHDYALEKLLPLVSRWQLQHLADGGTENVIELIEIVKKRIVAGMPSLCLSWKFVDVTSGLPEQFESCDAMFLVEKAYPAAHEAFFKIKSKKTAKRTCKAKQTVPKKRDTEVRTPVMKPAPEKKPRTESPKARKALVPVEEIEPVIDWGESFHDTTADYSNLSGIINDIVGKKSKIAEEEPPLHTSTPSSHGVLSRRPLKNVNTVDRLEDVLEESVEILEDTYDRMCK